MVWSLAIKAEAKSVMFLSKKRHIKGEKYITPMDFAEHLTKSDVSENNKVYYGLFQRNELHKRYLYIGKSRWAAQCLEVC